MSGKFTDRNGWQGINRPDTDRVQQRPRGRGHINPHPECRIRWHKPKPDIFDRGESNGEHIISARPPRMTQIPADKSLTEGLMKSDGTDGVNSNRETIVASGRTAFCGRGRGLIKSPQGDVVDSDSSGETPQATKRLRKPSEPLGITSAFSNPKSVLSRLIQENVEHSNQVDRETGPVLLQVGVYQHLLREAELDVNYNHDNSNYPHVKSEESVNYIDGQSMVDSGSDLQRKRKRNWSWSSANVHNDVSSEHTGNGSTLEDVSEVTDTYDSTMVTSRSGEKGGLYAPNSTELNWKDNSYLSGRSTSNERCVVAQSPAKYDAQKTLISLGSSDDAGDQRNLLAESPVKREEKNISVVTSSCPVGELHKNALEELCDSYCPTDTSDSCSDCDDAIETLSQDFNAESSGATLLDQLDSNVSDFSSESFNTPSKPLADMRIVTPKSDKSRHNPDRSGDHRAIPTISMPRPASEDDQRHGCSLNSWTSYLQDPGIVGWLDNSVKYEKFIPNHMGSESPYGYNMRLSDGNDRTCNVHLVPPSVPQQPAHSDCRRFPPSLSSGNMASPSLEALPVSQRNVTATSIVDATPDHVWPPSTLPSQEISSDDCVSKEVFNWLFSGEKNESSGEGVDSVSTNHENFADTVGILQGRDQKNGDTSPEAQMRRPKLLVSPEERVSSSDNHPSQRRKPELISAGYPQETEKNGGGPAVNPNLGNVIDGSIYSRQWTNAYERYNQTPKLINNMCVDDEPRQSWRNRHGPDFLPHYTKETSPFAASDSTSSSPSSITSPSSLPYYKRVQHLMNSTDSSPVNRFGFLDTHCHIDYLFRRLDYKGTFTAYMREHQFPQSFDGCVAVFCDPDAFYTGKWRSLLNEDKVWGAFGIHPHSSNGYNDIVERGIKEALSHPKAVALGEIGLDFSDHCHCDKVTQYMVFERQLRLAIELGKPLVIHSRQAENETTEILRRVVPHDYKIHRHCFTGTTEQARQILSVFPNLYIGLTALVTYHSAKQVHKTAIDIPLDRILLETDAPFFVPQQVKKTDRSIKWSNPGMAVFVAQRIAELKGIPVSDVLTATRKNAKDMYGV